MKISSSVLGRPDYPMRVLYWPSNSVSYDWCWVRTKAPPPAGVGTGSPIKTDILALNPRYSKHCHMDLWSAQLVDRVSSSFLLVVFFSGRLPFALVWLGLELLSSSPPFLVDIWWELPFYLAHWPPVWLPRLLFHWSCGWTVPLTLVLKLLASAELQLYRTSLPCLIISRAIWSEWTRPRRYPLA